MGGGQKVDEVVAGYCADIFSNVGRVDLAQSESWVEDPDLEWAIDVIVDDVRNKRAAIDPTSVASFDDMELLLTEIHETRPELVPYLWRKHYAACVENRENVVVTAQPGVTELRSLPFHNPHEHLSGSVPAERLAAVVNRVLDEKYPIDANISKEVRDANIVERQKLLNGTAKAHIRGVSKVLVRDLTDSTGLRLDEKKLQTYYECEGNECVNNFDAFEEAFVWCPDAMKSFLESSPLYWKGLLEYHLEQAGKGVVSLKFSPTYSRLDAIDQAISMLKKDGVDVADHLRFQFGIGRWQRGLSYAECKYDSDNNLSNDPLTFCFLEDVTAGSAKFENIMPLVSAVDIYGDEEGLSAWDYARLAIDGRKLSLTIGDAAHLGHEVDFTPHAGESGDAENIWIAMLLGAKSVGHGLGAAQDPILLEVIKRLDDMTLEACITSNETLYPESPPGSRPNFHPAILFAALGIKIAFATDDGGILNTTFMRQIDEALKLGIPPSYIMEMMHQSLEDIKDKK